VKTLPINQVICGDCVEMMKEWPENSIDCVVTDYFISKKWDIILNMKVERVCPICGKTFFIERSRAKHGRGITCSKECQNKWVSLKLKRGNVLKCPVCGKEFYCNPSRIRNAKYTPVCSRECLYKGRSLGIIQREVKNRYRSSPKTKVTKKCPICGRPFETVPSRLNNGRGKYCSRSCFEIAHKKQMAGNKNPSWIDGRSYDKKCYRGPDWEEIKKKVYERDNYTCQICGIRCIGRRDLSDENSYKLIQCHHIKEYNSEKDNELDNLITVCVACHAKIHSKKNKEVKQNLKLPLNQIILGDCVEAMKEWPENSIDCVVTDPPYSP